MATIRMKKGNNFADIFDSPETIQTALNEGYVIVKEEEKKPAKEEKAEKVEEPKPIHKKTGTKK